MNMAQKFDFSTKEAARLSGLSVNMVDYLCHENLIVPSGNKKRKRGRPREYLFGDVVMLRALALLLNQGISVANLKRSLKLLRKQFPEITKKSLPGKYLITNGKEIFFRTSANGIVDLTSGGQMVFGFVIEVSSIRNKIKEEVKKIEMAG